jgi:hypothetical protein
MNNDAAQVAIYEMNVIVAHGARDELFNYILFAIAHIGTDTAPTWFGSAISNALNQALVPLKRTITKVIFFILSHLM